MQPSIQKCTNPLASSLPGDCKRSWPWTPSGWPVFLYARIGFILLMLALGFLLVWDRSLAGEPQAAALVRIEIASDRQLERFAALDLPIYAQLWDDRGEMYLLVEGDLETQVQLDQLAFSYQVLDPDAREAAYYLLYTPHPLDETRLSAVTTILDRTARHILVRGYPLETGDGTFITYEIQRLIPHPLVLPDPQAELQSITAVSPDPYVQSMIEQVGSATAYTYVGNLSGAWDILINDNPYRLSTRHSFSGIPIKKATKFVYEHFAALGLASDFDDYLLVDVPLRHVIAEQPGLTNPGCLILLVAHLDSRSEDLYASNATAPGADDNASGSAGVLMAADVLHQYDFACTIRYILFTGEEQIALPQLDYFGSTIYAQEIKGLGENVAAVINLDMIGYNSDIYEIIELHTRYGNAGDLAIANLFKSVIQEYDINLTTEIEQDNLSWSDHWSFWHVGYPAILAMEDWEDFTPYYHKTSDQLNTLDISYMRNFIRAAVGTVAHLAGPLPPEPPLDVQLFIPLILKSE
ncbi:MAG: M28 family peptidase [Anaerolineales bacterium]|nr:M28 family peptidase [Anaerolineales bacterium]